MVALLTSMKDAQGGHVAISIPNTDGIPPDDSRPSSTAESTPVDIQVNAQDNAHTIIDMQCTDASFYSSTHPYGSAVPHIGNEVSEPAHMAANDGTVDTHPRAIDNEAFEINVKSSFTHSPEPPVNTADATDAEQAFGVGAQMLSTGTHANRQSQSIDGTQADAPSDTDRHPDTESLDMGGASNAQSNNVETESLSHTTQDTNSDSSSMVEQPQASPSQLPVDYSKIPKLVVPDLLVRRFNKRIYAAHVAVLCLSITVMIMSILCNEALGELRAKFINTGEARVTCAEKDQEGIVSCALATVYNSKLIQEHRIDPSGSIQSKSDDEFPVDYTMESDPSVCYYGPHASSCVPTPIKTYNNADIINALNRDIKNAKAVHISRGMCMLFLLWMTIKCLRARDTKQYSRSLCRFFTFYTIFAVLAAMMNAQNLQVVAELIAFTGIAMPYACVALRALQNLTGRTARRWLPVYYTPDGPGSLAVVYRV